MDCNNLGARPKTKKETSSNLCHENETEESLYEQENAVAYNYIDQIPDEVLEYIFKLISSYGDFTACSRVCSRWREVCKQASKSKQISFHNQVTQGRLLCKHYQTEVSAESISKRHSQCAVYHAPSQSMFVFGGCTSTSSTFNDLLQFDLTNRTWSRPRAIGTYPSPKALATMIGDKGNLILFGGWTHLSPYPLHQTWKIFSELHIFDIQESRWCHVQPSAGDVWPPPTAGHSATLHKDKMVVFGGLQKTREVGLSRSSNDVWGYSTTQKTWTLQPILGESRPCGRYSQSQIYLDDQHLLIMGGCAEISHSELKDIWLLDMKDEEGWRWRQMLVEGLEYRGKDIWKHPACRVTKDRVVVLGRQKVTSRKQSGSAKTGDMPISNQVTRNVIGTVNTSSRLNYSSTSSSSEENEIDRPSLPRGNDASAGAMAGASSSSVRSGSGNNGSLISSGIGLPEHHRRSECEGGSNSNSRSVAAKPPKQRAMENRQRQLATLNRVEERIRNSKSGYSHKSGAGATSPPANCPNCKMRLTVLDTSKAISHHTVTWLPPSPLLPGCEAPQDRMLYSLVKGRAELILFGGYKSDNSLGNIRDVQSVTNSVYILYPNLDRI